MDPVPLSQGHSTAFCCAKSSQTFQSSQVNLQRTATLHHSVRTCNTWVSSVHAMKAYRKRKCTQHSSTQSQPRYTSEVSDQHHAPATRSMGGAGSRTGRFGDKSSAPTGIRIQDRPARSRDAHTDYANLDVCNFTETNKDMQANMSRIKRNESEKKCNTSNTVRKAFTQTVLYKMQPKPQTTINNLTTTYPYESWPPPTGLNLPAPAAWVMQLISTALLQSYWLSTCASDP
jgi:hypothetical protein